MRIIINFGDSDFSMFIMDTAKRYCDKYSELLEYWEQLYSKSEYSEKLTKTFSDIKYIQQFFIKGVVGELIKHLEDKEVLDTSMFEHILKYTKGMFNDKDFTIVSDCEFDKSKLGYCEYLVLYFQNGTINYDVL